MDYSPHTGPTRPRVVAPEEMAASGLAASEAADGHLREAMLARVGEVVPGGWRLERLHWIGATSVLFGAADGDGGRHAVVKLMRPELAADGASRKRFHHEAELVAKVPHAGLVSIFEHGVSARGEPFLVLEQLVGETVQSYWSRHERGVGFQPVLRMMVPVLQALLACHERGITYLNVNPANIFLVKGGAVKLLDFGLAQSGGRPGPVPASQANPGFMAPEQALDRGDYGPTTDIFGVGATMFALLTGSPLNVGEDDQERRAVAATTPPPPLLSVAPLLPREVGELVDHALAWDAADRFTNTRQMGQALVSMLERVAELEDEAQQLISASLSGDLSPGVDLAGAPPPLIFERYHGLPAVFGQLQRLLEVAIPAGWDDERATNHRGRALSTLRNALRTAPNGLELEIWPGHFGPAHTPLWRPTGPCEALARRLYGAGIRAMVLEAEVDDDELERWCRFLAEVAGSEAGPSPAARFEAAGFEQVAARMCVPLAALPSLGEASLPLQSLLRLLEEQASFWIDAGQAPSDAEGCVERIEDGKVEAVRAWLRGDAHDAGTAGEAGEAGDAGAEGGGEAGGAALRHLPAALASADEYARRHGSPEVLVEGVAEQALAWLHAGQWQKLARFWGALDDVVAPEIGAAYARAAFPGEQPERLDALLAALAAEPARAAAAPDPLVSRGLTGLLRGLGSAPADAVVAQLPRISEPAARTGVLGYVLQHLDGREAALAPLLRADADPELMMTLLDALAEHEGPSALAALRLATQHPAPEVWKRALSLRLARGGGEPLRDLRRLLVENEAATRMDVLDLIEAHAVAPIAEVLAERIHDSTFLEASDEERRRLMDVLMHIDAVRAEAVCIEVLKRRGLVASKARDASRLLAAEYLGKLGRGEEALEALAYATKPRWWNSRELQTVATRSHSLVTSRMAEGL